MKLDMDYDGRDVSRKWFLWRKHNDYGLYERDLLPHPVQTRAFDLSSQQEYARKLHEYRRAERAAEKAHGIERRARGFRNGQMLAYDRPSIQRWAQRITWRNKRVISERDAEILCMRIVEKKTYKVIGEAVGLSKCRVGQICWKALKVIGMTYENTVQVGGILANVKTLEKYNELTAGK